VLLLRSLLAKGEKGFPLRREYIRQLGLTGDYAEAFAEFDRLRADQGNPADSLWMLEIEVAAWAFSSSQGKDTNGAERLRTAGEELLKAGAPSHLAWAGEKAGAAGAYDLAGRLYLRAAASDPLHPLWYRRAAEMSNAAGDCHGASAALFASLDRLQGAAERKTAFLDGLRALQACGALDEALAAADSRMPEWSGDTDVLLFLVRLAQAADNPGEAQHYAQLLVKPVASGPRP
jgi:Tfp pilus assembly protein PilF